MMKATEQTIQQIERALRKTADKFPPSDEATQMTDIHISVTQESGELLTFDDNDRELTRCVVEQWIGNKDDDFYESVSKSLHKCINNMKQTLDNLSILKPYSFVLEDDDREVLEELYMVDDEIGFIDPVSIDSLDSDLDAFLDKLMND
jgi:hypothetical protein